MRQGTLRPVERYAVRWLEEAGPAFDLDAAAAAAARDGDNRADWDVDQLQALQAQQARQESDISNPSTSRGPQNSSMLHCKYLLTVDKFQSQ